MPVSPNRRAVTPDSVEILDEVAQALLPIFLEEADELIPKMQTMLHAWRRQPTNQAHVLTLKRLLHTFKGSARMVGAMKIGALAHHLESRLAFSEQDSMQLSDWNSLESDFVQLNALVTPLRLPPTLLAENALCAHTFASLKPRFERVVAQTAWLMDKKAQLLMSGDEFPLHRTTLNVLATSLDHLLRNAVVHGLESAQERQRLGKPEIGCIRLNLSANHSQWIIRLSDDGAGLNLQNINKKYNEINKLDNFAPFNLEFAKTLIFTAGFSTSPEVNEIAGRGMGLPVVQHEIQALGGKINVASEPNQGVEFTLYFPKNTG